MRARAWIMRDTGEFPVSDHTLKIDGEYIFPIGGGIVDEETGYHLLGYKITGMWLAPTKYEIRDVKLTRTEPKPLPASSPSSNLPLAESLCAELLTKLTVFSPRQNYIARAVYNVTHSIDELVALLGDGKAKV